MATTDLSTIDHHPAIEEIAELLCTRTQNSDRRFFRIVTAYFLGKMAASMRVTVTSKVYGQVPVNVYAVALAGSGFGKGHSINILEDQLIKNFRKNFTEDTFPLKADEHLWKLAIERAASSGLTENEEKDSLDKEFRRKGALPFTFDGGTVAGVRQIREKLLLANCGAINLQVDEIGSNFTNAKDIMVPFLELYDQGLIKQSLIKNSDENVRSEDMTGKTPTNALLFGTPVKLLDGGKTEDEFFSMLQIGYARRSLFAWGEKQKIEEIPDPVALYTKLTNPKGATNLNQWSGNFALLADPTKYGWDVEVPDDVGIALLAYKIDCEARAEEFTTHDEIRRAEMSHRYFKVMKLAGAFAFVDEALVMTLDHLHQAMKLVEEGGEAFERMLTREKSHVRLAKYIAETKEVLTHADLKDALSFYPANGTGRNDLMQLAMGWGHKNCVIIRKSFMNGIEFFEGESLEKNDLSDMIFSYSDNMAYNYATEEGPVAFKDLEVLATAPGVHWCNHAFENGHRLDQNAIPGFNMVVVDVDGGVSLSTVQDLLKDQVFMTYTTKRHSEADNRFRLILPIDYTLKLDQDDYKEFMNNVLAWLPFKSDDGANQRARKWLSHPGSQVHMNLEGALLDSMQFIPRTSPNEHYRSQMQSLESLDNLERWFAQRIATGNRNNHMAQFAFALVSSGMNYFEIEETVLNFNAKLNNPLPVDEIKNTILITVARKIAAKAA